MSKTFSRIGFLFFLLYANSAYAQGVSQCEGAKTINTASSSQDIATKFSVLSTISEKEFSEAKQQASLQGTFQIAGIPISPDLNWSDFDKSRREFLSKYKVDFSQRLMTEWRSTFLSPMASEMYQSCLNALRIVGPHIIVTRSDPKSDLIVGKLSFITADGDETTRTADFSSVGGDLIVSDAVKQKMTGFVGSQSFGFIFKRSSIKADAAIVVNIGGVGSGTATLVIPGTPSIKVLRKERVSITKMLQVSASEPGAQATKEGCIPTSNEEMALAQGVTFIPDLASIELISHAEFGDFGGSITVRRSNQICGEVHVGADRSGTGMSAAYNLFAIGERDVWEPLLEVEPAQ